ncbi:MAG TPA: hypothetical protein DCS60_08760 [Opitutae bacterium]|nr:hypothetical protein [Opitutae bacterium]
MWGSNELQPLVRIDRFYYVVKPFVVFGWGVGHAPKKQKLNGPSNSGFFGPAQLTPKIWQRAVSTIEKATSHQ